MIHLAQKVSGLALLGVILSSPVVAGHMSDKGSKHHCHHPMMAKHAMKGKSGHAHGHNMKKRHMAYGMPAYGRPYGPMAMGPRYDMGKDRGYTKQKYRGYGPMSQKHSAGMSSYGQSKGYRQKGYAGQASAAPADQAKNIVETAVDAGQFSTLVKATQAAGLVGTLNSEGPFTVFAPTDEAFAKLPEGTVEGLLQDTEALTKVLAYHVTGGKVLAADLLEKGSVETLNGESVELGQLAVVKADIVTSNGVIHVIDEVMLPPES